MKNLLILLFVFIATLSNAQTLLSSDKISISEENISSNEIKSTIYETPSIIKINKKSIELQTEHDLKFLDTKKKINLDNLGMLDTYEYQLKENPYNLKKIQITSFENKITSIAVISNDGIRKSFILK